MGTATLRARWGAFLDRQHRDPAGLVGQLVGERMVRQHAPETAWTLDLLGIQPADQLLELGFGAGRALALAAERAPGGLVLGLDRSPTMVRAAARRNRAASRAGHIALLRGNLGALPFAGRRFDKIWSIHTFYFWPDPPRLVAELLRLLAPGGTLAITMATGHDTPGGARAYWPLHQRVELLVSELRERGTNASLEHGPDSRQYNNVAIVVRG
jgi:SAM-dependent methyltransferase